MLTYNPCNLCPRLCGVDRNRQKGFCQSGNQIKVARAALHFWEEPCLSGSRGSGTVFFSGCTLRCCYCQNYSISIEGFGKEVSPERLADMFEDLQAQGAHNINLVTATHFLPGILQALEHAKPRLHIPIVYNCGGYERVETIQALKDYVDIFLPDFKYFSSGLSWKYSQAKDYFSVAAAAIQEMVRQTGGLVYNKEGILQKGVIIRHLVLPGARKDSMDILNWIHDHLPADQFILSLMSQYTPCYKSRQHPEIDRRLTTAEYRSVVQEALRLGLGNGYMQERTSAREEYTPPFDLEGV